MSYVVHLEVFEGPFDLLLQLISKRKLDVTEVDLADITSDFLASLGDLDALDLETATRFLVVAATLVELKAARLLPREERDELEDLLGEARDLLYARLLEYRAFRVVADQLTSLVEANLHHHGRDVLLDARWRRLVPDAPLGVSAEDLARLAARATAPKPEPEVPFAHIRRTFISIQEAATSVLTRIAAPGSTSQFRTLVSGRSRGDAVVFFLALLELYKLGHLDLDQPDHRGELVVARLESGADLSVLSELDRAMEAAAAERDAAADAPADETADETADDSSDVADDSSDVQEALR